MSVAELPYPGIPGGLSLGGAGGGSSLWLLDDDTQLRITTANSVAGVVVGITGLRIDDKGRVQPIDETHTPNTDRSSKTQDYKIGRGTLLRLTVFVVTGAPLSGQTYVLAQLIRGVSGPRKVITTLLGGYVTAIQALGFPGSPIVSSTAGEPVVRYITGTKPAAGGQIHETVPSGARWELLSLLLQLGTSGAAGTRFPDFRVLAPTTVGQYLSNVGIGPGVAAALIQFAPSLPNVVYAGFSFGTGGFAARVLLRANDGFGTDTLGFDAADQYETPWYQVREWLEVAA